MQAHTNVFFKFECDVDLNRQRARQKEVGNECQMVKEKKKYRGTLMVLGFLWVSEGWQDKRRRETEWRVCARVCEVGVECGLSLCLLHSSSLSLLSPFSLFLAHYPLRQQTSPWAAAKRTVLSRSHRQPQPGHCPALLILINTHSFKLAHRLSPVSSSDGQAGGQPSLLLALTCKWDIQPLREAGEGQDIRKVSLGGNFVFIIWSCVTDCGRRC